MKFIFVDTNIFLHYTFFVEIPWSKLFGQPYQIVLAPVVIDELDKHKRNSNAKIAARSKQVLSRIEKMVETNDPFPLTCITQRPKSATLSEFQLDRQEQDDVILASIIEFGILHPTEEIVFVTNDTGPRLRASSLNIKTDRLPDDLLNAIEQSEERKLLQRLTQENSRLKNAIPKLSLTFEDDKLVFMHRIKPYEEEENLYVKTGYDELLREYPLLQFENPEIKKRETQAKIDTSKNMLEKLSLMASMSPLGLHSLSEKQVSDYNAELENFYKEYKIFLTKSHRFKQVIALTLPVKVKMHNKGTTPATDIDIWLHFPDGFLLVNEEKFPKEPKKPTAPYKPAHRFDMRPMNLFIPNVNHFHDTGSQTPPVNFSRPDIRQTNSYEVDIHFRALKHYQNVLLDPLLVIYPSASETISFTIDYRIIANNIPEPVVGQLSIVLQTE